MENPSRIFNRSKQLIKFNENNKKKLKLLNCTLGVLASVSFESNPTLDWIVAQVIS